MTNTYTGVFRSQILTPQKAAIYNQEHVIVPDHIRLISSNTFSRKSKIKRVTFPETLLASLK